MSVEQVETEDRPCLHCAFVDLIDEFFVELGEAEIETDEVLEAIAKTVAEFTSGLDESGRQKIIEQLMRQVMHHDAEFRRENESGSSARH